MVSKDGIPDNMTVSLQWIELDRFLVEYNPKRYKLYASLFPTNNTTIREMAMSPMFDFIFTYYKTKHTGKNFVWTNTKYYKMQLLYGRSHSHAVAKMSRFISLFGEIEKQGVKTRPLVISEGEHGKFQIKDGHHRIACAMALGYKKLICNVITGAVV